MKYILGIDIGTTAIKAAVIGEDGEIYGTKTSEYPLTTLPSGEVEADLSLYEEAFKQSIKESVKNARVPVKDIKCIGFSSTAETCVFLDENNKPLCKVIAWMDTRATKEAKELTEQFEKQDIIKKVGFDGIYAIHPVSKILAVKHKTPEIFEKTRMFAQIKDYFIFKLTGTYYTDHSTASDHGFFDITNRCYWKEMLAYTGIKEEYLPKLEEPGTELGMISESAAKEFGLDPQTKINVGAFDQGCGAIGAGNIKSGIASESTGSALVTVATIDQLNPESKGWNVYDIIYTAPTFKEDGSYRTHPTVTVIQNGVVLQNHTTILGTTEWIGFPQVKKHGAGPIILQSHGDPSEPISFRNIWIREL